MFYRLHSFVDDIFQEHKSTLPRYDVNRVSDRDRCVIHVTHSGSTSFDIQDDCRWIQDTFPPYIPHVHTISHFFLPTFCLNFSFCHHFFLCNLLLLVLSIILVVIVIIIIVIIIMSLLMK